MSVSLRKAKANYNVWLLGVLLVAFFKKAKTSYNLWFSKVCRSSCEFLVK